MSKHLEYFGSFPVFISLHEKPEIGVEYLAPIFRPDLRHAVLAFRQTKIYSVYESANRAVDGIFSVGIDIHTKKLHPMAHRLEIDFVRIFLLMFIKNPTMSPLYIQASFCRWSDTPIIPSCTCAMAVLVPYPFRQA